MHSQRTARLVAVLAVGALAACGTGDATGSGDRLEGTLNSAGASTQAAAMEAWNAGFSTAHAGVTFNYDAIGSGSGREQFLAGGSILVAGSDAPLDEAERAAATVRCDGASAIEIPAYVSPIAVAYNLPGVTELRLAPRVLAGIFDQTITRWDAQEIRADNPGATLPALRITPVNRADKSGTTENFTTYLADAGEDAWPHEASQTWPVSGGEAADGTSGVVAAVAAGEGAIGYADASQVMGLGVAKIRVGGTFVDVSPEGAAALVDLSPRVEGLPPGDIVVDLDRTTTDPSAYPISLVSYLIACGAYESPEQDRLVQAFLSYVVSQDGQEFAAENAGSAPIGEKVRADAQAAIASLGPAVPSRETAREDPRTPDGTS